MGDAKIPFKYCKIGRASELLEVKAEDIINLAANGYIELCANLYMQSALLIFDDGVASGHNILNLERVIDGLESLYFSNDKALSNYSSFSFSEKNNKLVSAFLNEGENTDREMINYFNKNNTLPYLKYTATGVAAGLWALPTYAIRRMEFNEDGIFIGGDSSSSCRLYISGEDRTNFESKIHLTVLNEEDIVLKKDDLWINREDVNLLLRSEINIDNLKSMEILTKISTSSEGMKVIVEDELSTKTINSRAQFIKALLYTMYDSDVADNPRKYLENHDSEISELFKAKGIKAPNGRTVQAWVNMVDIPFSEEKQ